jgi:hypothetical protein
MIQQIAANVSSSEFTFLHGDNYCSIIVTLGPVLAGLFFEGN